MTNTQINESIVPLDFSWRAGIGKDSNDAKPRSIIGGYYPIYFNNEYWESLWYELLSEIEDNAKGVALHEPMNSTTYGKILFSIDSTICSLRDRYDAMSDPAFITELERISESLENKFYFTIKSWQNGLPKPISLVKEALYIDEESGSILVNPKYIIHKIKKINNI